ncbi:MAG: methyl-accepting chemotaxis protein [Bacteroidetes bacterium]|nr:methyl-accepting chemotaxis protein [Bacteroidota bacterium]
MHWINNIRLSTRTIISFGTAAVVLVLCTLFLTSTIDKYAATGSKTLPRNLTGLQAYDELYAYSLKAESAGEDALLDDSSAAAKYQSAADGFTQEMDALLNKHDASDTDTLTEISQIWSAIRQRQAQLQSSAPSRYARSRLASSGDLKEQYSNLRAKISPLSESGAERISLAGLQEVNSAAQLDRVMWYLTGFLVIAIFGAAFACYRSLIVPLRLFKEVTCKISDGKFGSLVDLKTKDEFGELADSFNGMSMDIAKLASYLNAVGNPVYAVDRQFTVQFANSAALRLAGKEYDDVVGKKKCHDVFGLPFCKSASCPVSRAWDERRMITGESNAVQNDKEIPVLYQAASVLDLEGNAIRGVEVLTDISEMKAFANKLETQRLYLSKSVNSLLKEMSRLAEGDLTVAMDVKENDEIGRLFDGFNRAVSNFRTIVEQVIQSVRSTAGASSEISNSAEILTAGAHEQSTQAGEVAAAVEEMTRTVIDNARNAAGAVEAVTENGKVAQDGGEVVQRAVLKIKEIAEVVKKSTDTVNQLGQLSGEIGEIVSVIDDIADQTNLLALNAAIEAARAGEEGRGFAVVADEVRKLAERTSQATKQISSMIKNIQAGTTEAVETMRRGNEQVTEGIMLADQADESLKNVVSNARSIIDMINQIAAASEEQSSASEQISRNVEAISSVSSDSAKGISQIAKAADGLSKLTVDLQRITSKLIVEPDRNLAFSSPK